jgi:hypothetical protein
MQVLSAYELDRLQNMRENDRELDKLGLFKRVVAAPGSSGQARQKAQRRANEHTATLIRKSARGSAGRTSPTAAGAAGGTSTATDTEAVLARADGRDVRPLPRPNGTKRTLSLRQSALLDSMEEGGASPLTPQEVTAVHAARHNLRGVGLGSGYKGRNTWEERRALLRGTAGVRRPSWLDALAKSVDFGKTPEARAQTLFALERAAAGLGLEYAGWPVGVGVLLGGVTEVEMHGVPLAGVRSEEGTAGAGGDASGSGEAGPVADLSDGAQLAEGAAECAIKTDSVANDVVPLGRLLTLGSDTESLRREGQRRESRWSRDRGNGWVYNHCLNKLRHYQEALLLQIGQSPEGPTVEDMEEGHIQRHG